ncbi:UDP-N-acetylmuramoyl-tripeptide--D-alanyl-D-alanine ligase [Flavobacteriaceae bacterium]|nr:UDP-N-acetylmuramoyl-tripeptide--D-alanyl-D-alanine ligase [Flavobacteriaceae bacterium]
MTNLQLKEILKAVEAVNFRAGIIESQAINQVVIDSRNKVINGLFFAIKGPNNDGHLFLEEAFANGCQFAIVQYIPKDFLHSEKLILVKDVFLALNQLAIYNRKKFQGLVIAITGSVGKTSIKEMLGLSLKAVGKTFISQKNFNNHFGVPLNLCNLDSNADYAILELGMNHRGEIRPLAEMVMPDIAVISNIGKAHIGNFSHEEEIALEKSDILFGLRNDGIFIIDGNCKFYDLLQKKSQEFKVKNIISVGNEIKIKQSQNIDAENSIVKIDYFSTEISYHLPTINDIFIQNSLFTLAVLKSLKINNLQKAIKELGSIKPVQGRGDLIKVKIGDQNLQIIDDSYNASLSSIEAAIKYLAKLKKTITKYRTIAFIGDVAELGQESEIEHQKIATYLIENKIDKVFFVGMRTAKIIDLLPKKVFVRHFKNSDFDFSIIRDFFKDGDIVLFKGSRVMQMEKIITKFC